jgi:BMFP domain-containing protein YqiC
MKGKDFFAKILTKAGVDATSDKFKAAIDAVADIEIDDADAEAVVDSLLTEDEAAASTNVKTKAETKAKAEIWDGVDVVLKKFVPKLNAQQKAEYDKLGKDSNRKYQYLLKTFSEKGTQAGDDLAGDLEEKVQAAIDERIEKGELVKKEEFEAVTGKVTDAQRKARQAEAVMLARKKQNFNEAKEGRYFQRDLWDDVETLLSEGLGDKKKVTATIDLETGEIRQKDATDQRVTIGGKNVTLDDVVSMVVEKHYAKTSEETKEPGQASVRGTQPEGLSVAKQRMAERLKVTA